MPRLAIFLVALPAFAVLPGREPGGFLTLYREPKLVAFAVLAWLWMAVLAWSPAGERVWHELPKTLGLWPVRALLAFVAYMAATGLWGQVPSNAFYELRSLVLGAFWMVALVAWQRSSPRASEALSGAIVLGMAFVTALAAWQWWNPIPWLPPILPELGGRHASTFGFKNPAALAVVGQWFLLVWWLLADRRRWARAIAGLLMAAQAIYVASLQSRTAMMALLAGLLFLAVFGAWRPATGTRRRWIPTVAVIGVVFFGVALASYAPWRDRADQALGFLLDPASYLESNRGAFALNTFEMVRQHPFGVGLGDWQTAYPIFRRHQPELGFDADVEVRRAHSDHVQFFGEGGWPGLALWTASWLVVVGSGLRHWRRTGSVASLCCTVQVAAWFFLMATDYVIEMPFHRFQFFLILSLAIAVGSKTGESAASEPSSVDPSAETAVEPERRTSRGLRVALATVLLAACVTEMVSGALLLRRERSAAVMSQSYQRALVTPAPAQRRALLARALQSAERFARGSGYTKSTPSHERIAAHVFALAGAEAEAVYWLRRSLRHQPYSPASLDLAALLTREEDRQLSAAWRRAARYVREEAERGYRLAYPKWPDERPPRPEP